MSVCDPVLIVKDNVLLLVGCTGNGKSSTANSLIGQQFFTTTNGDLCIKKETVEIDGSKVTVVDGTGIGDTGSDMIDDLQEMIQKAETAVQLCESGFNALIFVMTYGKMFTEQEKDAVDLIRSIFGRDIFNRFGVIVMTCGDRFEMDKEFDQWFKLQTGPIKNLFDECQNRCVLFDNKTGNDLILSKQRELLLSLISHSNKYTLEDYQKQNRGHRELIFDIKFPEREIQNKKIVRNVEKLLKDFNLEGDLKKQKEMLQELLLKLEKQIEDIKHEFKDSIYLKTLLMPLHVTQLKVELIIPPLQSAVQSKEYVLGTENSRYTKDVETFDRQNYVFLLVGKSGNGKSSTGNSIFGKTVFITRNPHDSFNGDVICYHSALVDERSVFVVDGTGIGDDINKGVTELLESVDFTMRNVMSKFNAIILVHYIHERSQVKMKSSVHDIKSILGPNVLKNWGIIVVTFGDLFDVNNLEKNIHSFEDWCEQQTGYFQILLKECNTRCVLFDNKTTDKNKQMEQRNKLMSVVDSMTYKPYTIDDFDMPTCKLSRQQLILMEEVNRTF